MPESLEYNPAMGSMEAHIGVMKSRMDDAKADYDRAVAKGIPAQIENARKTWLAAQEAYEQFMSESGVEETKKRAVS